MSSLNLWQRQENAKIERDRQLEELKQQQKHQKEKALVRMRISFLDYLEKQVKHEGTFDDIEKLDGYNEYHGTKHELFQALARLVIQQDQENGLFVTWTSGYKGNVGLYWRVEPPKSK